jgi:solute:Na+ symporter, SSS family
LLVATIAILWKIGWSTLTATVEQKYGAAGFNPFIHPEMGWPYLLFQTCINTAACLTWQTQISRVLAAKDSRTGRRIYTRTSFFFVCRFLIPGIFGIAALGTLDATVFSALSPQMQAQQSLYAMPIFLGTFLPVGLLGILVAAMIAADMSTDSSYMLGWASVIYNDIVGPFRKDSSEKRGILWNRSIVAGIGIFLLFYGLWYQIEGNLWDYLTVTGTIYLSSMSVLLIACCYWKRANAWGAIGAIIAGAAFPVAFLVLQKLDATRDFANEIGPYFSGLAAYAFAALAMIVGSLLAPKRGSDG